MYKFLFLFFSFGFLFQSLPVYAEIGYQDVLELSKQSKPDAVRFAEENGAKVVPFHDGRSFAVWWESDGFDPKQDTVLVCLHGHEGWAMRDFQVWYPHLKGRRYAFLGIQWWYGRNKGSMGYAKPRDIYPWIQEVLEAKGIPPGHVIFQGFSMGSANSYAVTYLDRQQKTPYFAVTISNAGEMAEDFPPNRGFLDKNNGSKPFTGAHWILYCGEKDKERENSCEKMQRTKEQLEERGAIIDKFIRDPNGSHGGFMLSPNNCDLTLDLADQIVAKGSEAAEEISL